jgi:hypothetical protein
VSAAASAAAAVLLLLLLLLLLVLRMYRSQIVLNFLPLPIILQAVLMPA